MTDMASRFHEEEIRDKSFASAVGLVHELLVMGRKVDFGRREVSVLAHNANLLRRVGNLIQAHQMRQGWIPETVRFAQTVLGEENVLTDYDVVSVWDGRNLEDRINGIDRHRVPNWQTILQLCSAENERGATNWKLLYTGGLSLDQIMSRCAYHSFSPLCSQGLGINVHESKKTEFVSTSSDRPAPRFRLIDFKLRLPDEPRKKQEALVSQLGPDYSISHPATILDAYLSLDKYASEDRDQIFNKTCSQRGVSIRLAPPTDDMGSFYFRLGKESGGVLVQRSMYEQN